MGYVEALLTEEAQNEEVERAREISERWKVYLGDHEKPLKVTPPAKDGSSPAIDDNITPNFAGRFVDQGVSFLFGGDVVFTLDPGEEAPQETDGTKNPEEKELAAIWRVNRKRTLLPKYGQNGAVAGHGFFKLIEPIADGAYPRILNLDPATVSVAWDEEDIDTVIAYKVQWRVMRDGKPMVRRQLIEIADDGRSWTIKDEVGEQVDRPVYQGGSYWQWTVIEDVDWPYPFAPIVDNQNLPLSNVYYGTPDLSCDVIDLNTAVSRVMSNLARVIRFHGHPKTIFKGVEEGEVRIDADGAIYLPDGENQDVFNLEMKSDLTASLDVYRELYDALHEVGRRPKIAAGKLDNIGQLSGLAIKILYGPLNEVTATKQGPYGDGLVELNKRLLALSGKRDYASVPETTVHWPDMVPHDPLEDANAGIAAKEMGVSKETWLEKHGYDARTESERSGREATAATEASATAFDQGRGDLG